MHIDEGLESRRNEILDWWTRYGIVDLHRRKTMSTPSAASSSTLNSQLAGFFRYAIDEQAFCCLRWHTVFCLAVRAQCILSDELQLIDGDGGREIVIDDKGDLSLFVPHPEEIWRQRRQTRLVSFHLEGKRFVQVSYLLSDAEAAVGWVECVWRDR